MIPISDSIQYSGNAKIKIMKGNKVLKTINVHNKGEDLLFKVMASALCGFNISNSIPRYLALGKVDGNTFISQVATRASLTGRVVAGEQVLINGSEVGATGALFTTYIPNSNIINKDYIEAFAIFQSFSGDDRLATITLTETDKAELQTALSMSGSFSVVVEWLMVFSNYPQIITATVSAVGTSNAESIQNSN